MSLDPKYIELTPVQVQSWDKDLNVPLAAGTYTFLRDADQVTAKDVYQLVGNGLGTYSYVSLGNVLTLSAIGTFVDGSGNNIVPYYWPYEGTPSDMPPSNTVDLYYIEVVSSSNVPQFTVTAQPPGLFSLESLNEASTTDNIITNSQFVNVLFSTDATSASPVSISLTGSNTITQLAPDWFVITNGSGTLNFYQQPITDTTAPNNPSYALGISSSGFSTAVSLRQRIYTPRIFSGNFVSGTFIAEAYSGGPYTLTMNYIPSGTMTPQLICSGMTPVTGFGTIYNSNAVTITSGAAGQAPTDYVDIEISIPVNASIQISNIQICGVSSSSEIVNYLQNTPAEEVNGLFHYYFPQLAYKPIPSYLIGWDFPLNPSQFGFTGSLGTLGGTYRGAYAWDQTILMQSVDNTITYSSGTFSELTISATGTTQLAIIQYLELDTVLNMVNSNLSSLVRVSVSTSITFTISLWVTSNTNVPNLPATLITTLDANGHPSAVVSGWTEIINSNGNATFTTSSPSNNDFGFSGWLAGQIPSTTTNFAIVIGTSALANTNALEFHSISLVPGDIPTIPAPQTIDEVLRECQYYYEKSYSNNVLPGATSATANQLFVSMESVSVVASGNAFSYATPFSLIYRVEKRVPASIQFYDPVAGTAGNVLSTLFYTSTGGAFASTTPASQVFSTWWSINGGNKALYLTPININPLSSTNVSSMSNIFSSASIAFQYVADARLGVI